MIRLLDSNILIYAAKPEYAFLHPWVSSPTARVSAISIPEVIGYRGLASEDEMLFERWFTELIIEPVTESILRKAAALRRQRRMKLGDAIIAATAMELEAELVTRNVEDFRNIAGLRVINPFA